MVLGTPTMLTPASCSLAATPRVSSPPIAISTSTPRLSRLSLIRVMPDRPPLAAASASGFVRDEPRIVPPSGRMARAGRTASGPGAASRGAGPGEPRIPGIPPVLPGTGMGGAPAREHLAGNPRRVRPGPRARRGGYRDLRWRHQPAGDRGHLGSRHARGAPAGDRLAGPADGRAVGPAR